MYRHITVMFPFIALLSACNNSDLIIPNAKPDLIIESVSYQREPSCWEGWPSGVICSGVPIFKFTIKIRNVGDKDLDQFFYISNTTSDRDLLQNFCPHTRIVNYPPVKLAVGRFLNVSFSDFINDSTARVLFVINTNDLYSKGRHLPRIDELRYDNNSDTLDLEW